MLFKIETEKHTKLLKKKTFNIDIENELYVEDHFEEALEDLFHNRFKYFKVYDGSCSFKIIKRKKYIDCEYDYEPCNCCGGDIEIYSDLEIKDIDNRD
jgi:hypothetical protein